MSDEEAAGFSILQGYQKSSFAGSLRKVVLLAHPHCVKHNPRDCVQRLAEDFPTDNFPLSPTFRLQLQDRESIMVQKWGWL